MNMSIVGKAMNNRRKLNFAFEEGIIDHAVCGLHYNEDAVYYGYRDAFEMYVSECDDSNMVYAYLKFLNDNNIEGNDVIFYYRDTREFDICDIDDVFYRAFDVLEKKFEDDVILKIDDRFIYFYTIDEQLLRYNLYTCKVEEV